MSLHAEPFSHANALSEQQLCELEQGRRCRALFSAVLLDALEPSGACHGEPMGGFLTDAAGAWADSRIAICDAAGVDPDAFLEAARRSERPRRATPPVAGVVLAHLRDASRRIPAHEIASALGRSKAGVQSTLRSLKARGLADSSPHGWVAAAPPPPPQPQPQPQPQPPVHNGRAAKPRPLREAIRRAPHHRSARVLGAWSVGETCHLDEIQQRTGLSELHVRQAISGTRAAGHIFTNTALRTFRRDR